MRWTFQTTHLAIGGPDRRGCLTPVLLPHASQRHEHVPRHLPQLRDGASAALIEFPKGPSGSFSAGPIHPCEKGRNQCIRPTENCSPRLGRP
jgi:hypothetical protein